MTDPKGPNKDFTAAHVVAIVEELKSEFRAVIELVEPLPGRLDKIEERLVSVEERLSGVEAAVRVAIPSHEKRISRLEEKISA